MDTSEPVNNLDSHVLHHQEEEEEEVQDKEEVGQTDNELLRTSRLCITTKNQLILFPFKSDVLNLLNWSSKS